MPWNLVAEAFADIVGDEVEFVLMELNHLAHSVRRRRGSRGFLLRVSTAVVFLPGRDPWGRRGPDGDEAGENTR